MIRQQGSPSEKSNNPDVPKPGSNPEDVRKVGSPNDFGVREDDTIERNYTSLNTKAADPGNAQPRSGEDEEGDRQTGAGTYASGPGSGSGGDLDTDFVGLDGGGIAASGKVDEPVDAADTDGTSAQFASGPPAQGRNQKERVGKIGGGGAVKGSTHFAEQGGVESNNSGQGADAANNNARGDDSFVGEVSSDEASGREGD